MCWSKMWFFHHSPAKRCYFLEYLPCSPNFSWKIFYMDNVIACIGNKLLAIVRSNALILYSDCVSTCTLNSLYFSKHSNFDFNAYNHTSLRNHQWSLRNTLHYPWMWSTWGHTHPKVWSLFLPSFGNTTLYYLPLINTLQNNKNVEQISLPRFMSLTIFWNSWIPFTFKQPRYWCLTQARHLVLKITPNWLICKKLFHTNIHL